MGGRDDEISGPEWDKEKALQRDERYLRWVGQGLNELGVDMGDVGADFIVSAVRDMRPSPFEVKDGGKSRTQQEIDAQGRAGWLAMRLARRELELDK